jgi:hypothetical protein
MSTRRQIVALLLLGIALLLAGGVFFVQANPLNYPAAPQASGEIVAVDRSVTPPTVTFTFQTQEGETVTATTDRLVFVPPDDAVGLRGAVQYDPDNPQSIQMAGYERGSVPATLLAAGFAVCIGMAVLAWRRGRAQQAA